MIDFGLSLQASLMTSVIVMTAVTEFRSHFGRLPRKKQAVTISLLISIALFGNFVRTTFGEVVDDKISRSAINGHQLPFNVLVVLPENESNNDNFGITMPKARPVIDISVMDAIQSGKIGADFLNFTYHDSKFSENANLAERFATLGVVTAYCSHRLDAILGFADSYSLATTSKITAAFGHGVPVITTAGMVSNLGDRQTYPFLTRIQGSYRQMADSMYKLIAYREEFEKGASIDKGNGKFTSGSGLHSALRSRSPVQESRLSLGYQNLVLMYHDKRRAVNRPRLANGEVMVVESVSSHCYFTLYAIKNFFTEKSAYFKEAWKIQTPSLAFDEEIARIPGEIESWLKIVSELANVIILCASPNTVREIMLAAYDLGMATSGEYVFINIDVSTGSHAERPWLRSNDTTSRENEKAKKAYQALKTISLRRSDLDEYKNFESRVKERAEKKYNYSAKTGKEYEMNNFISAFYDALLLYAIALNETLTEGLDPRNGHNITSKMWSRTFVGITGNVSIDENGDRYSDYSLLDLDPQQDKFVEVAYYSGASNELKQVAEFHWVGGSPPRDSPICGWDHSKCPEGYPFYVYLLSGSTIFILILMSGFIYFWRRYRLEAELAAMSWKIRWEDLDGDEVKKDKKKSRRMRRLHGFSFESEALLRSYSRTSNGSENLDEDEWEFSIGRFRLRSTSSNATRKFSALIDRKLSLFTRKKNSNHQDSTHVQNHISKDFDHKMDATSRSGQHVTINEGVEPKDYDTESGRLPSPLSLVSNSKRKPPSEDGFDLHAKKSLSLRNRKLSFAGFSIGSGGSVETIQMQNNAQIYTKTANYKGTIVAVKNLNIDPKKYPKLDLTRSMLMEFKRIKDLQHDHITRFTGACVDCPHYCLVQEYCPKGSLEDILENEKIELDKMMKYSLLHDLVKGMYFLHNSFVGSHGKLKSSNCVVDSRFVLKVTDFGFHELHAMEDENTEEIGEHAFYKRRLWTAPEILRNPNAYRPNGTKAGDAYSFAIILHEMLFRKGAFYMTNEPAPKEICERVQRVPASDEELCRPEIPESALIDGQIEPNLINLMLSCWAEEFQDRPDFAVIRKVVRSLNKSNETSNVVDNLLKRMEQYANNLEGLVEERTQEYLAEKQKVEDLLHQLLPRSVADQLISGRAVQAEAFESVTIYFSDIVGFTALSSMSTPMQVVTLLNDLYMAFDGVVDNFKVYKVETIGDAYMVVSGLPERHNHHASQIAQMSLALLHKVKNFVIRHRPNEQLKLRIGIHSGPVVAGVVGCKMPRYCLFGDTVNTSSRMESTGLPLRIHVSSHTKTILEKEDPGFNLVLRGEVEMKGKGKQITYWLKGYNDIRIPDFGPEFE
ncbi:RGC/RGC protein kinase [Loa loa]|uniref:Guanylate cyclase n=1 Tax=Loa loa TaxID=7209 RepID=A0A1S0UHA3_LOALO|nr:RGC/RGC protein kinase [Loa loa]EJD74806.1 RGC/RGC protein kinase [Loa loa]